MSSPTVDSHPTPSAGQCGRWRALALAAAAGFAIVALFVVLGASRAIDLALLEYAGTLRTPGRTDLMIAVSLLGWGNVEIPLALALVGWLWYRRRPACARFYFGWTLSGWAVYALLKASFQRPRPSIIARLDGAGWWAFPSGHAMLAPIVYVLAAVLLAEGLADRKRAGALMAAAWLLVAAIGVSRVYLGVHYPTDVIAGLLAGTAWMAMALAFRSRNQAMATTSRSNAASASRLG